MIDRIDTPIALIRYGAKLVNGRQLHLYSNFEPLSNIMRTSGWDIYITCPD